MSTDARPPRAARRIVSVLVVAVLTLAVWWIQDRDATSGPQRASDTSSAQSNGAASSDPGGTDPESGLPVVAVGDLPGEARATLELIDRGGPFPYDRDGVTFENREEILPDRERGYYREYTVETPGSDDRGARRVVAGDGGELYWTQDHYDSFERIAR